MFFLSSVRITRKEGNKSDFVCFFQLNSEEEHRVFET